MKATYPVQGMSCASCAVSVESILKNMTGVKEATVNFSNQTALVEYSPEVVSSKDLIQAVHSIGYELLEVAKGLEEETMQKMQDGVLKKSKFQAIGSLAFAIPVAIMGMFFMDAPYSSYIQLALTAPVLFWFGRQFFISSWKKLKHGKASMDTLVSLSAGVAFILSLFNTIVPEYWHQRGLHPHVYYEAAAIVIGFVSLGKWLEEKAKIKTSGAIKKLIGMQAKTVFIINQNGEEEEIELDRVHVGDIILAKPGDKIAVDGLVSSGGSFVDESSITGEPLPASKTIGDKVFAGTINQQGTFQYVAEKVGQDTVIAKIIQMVQLAQGSKAPVQRFVDKVAGIFVPVVIGIAVLTFVAWQIGGGQNAFSQGILAAVTVMVIACPCALGLATPTAIMVGMGKGAEQHILIKDAESLEIALKVNTIVLDKTGTITQGLPEVIAIKWFQQEEGLIDILYTMESLSTHPLAQAVCRELKGEMKSKVSVEGYQNLPGKGAEMRVAGSKYAVGNSLLLHDRGIELSDEMTEITNIWGQQAQTVAYFTSNTEVLAMIAMADKIKDNSALAIHKLKNLGITIHMVTGDNISAAKAVADQVGIEHYQAERLPSDKAMFVQQLQKEGNIVAMVGDGINDSEALAQADISIAMGKGSDIAIDVAKVTLLTSDLSSISTALQISRSTVKTIHQNLFWAFIYNLIGIPIAAGILYPIWGILLSPMMASAAMALSSVSVVMNSLRLRNSNLNTTS